MRAACRTVRLPGYQAGNAPSARSKCSGGLLFVMLCLVQFEQHRHVFESVVDMFNDVRLQFVDTVIRIVDPLAEIGLGVVNSLADFTYAAVRIEEHRKRDHDADCKSQYLCVCQGFTPTLVGYQLTPILACEA